jgi:hypothetical protein
MRNAYNVLIWYNVNACTVTFMFSTSGLFRQPEDEASAAMACSAADRAAALALAAATCAPTLSAPVQDE